MNVKHTVVLVCAVLFVILLGYLKAREYILPKTVLIIGGRKVIVEIADSPVSRARGLGGHRPLAENEGMLFLFPSADSHQFWMKDMTFPIDIVWLNSGRVVDMAPHVPPPAFPSADLPIYMPRIPSGSTVELSAGFTEKYGVKIGDSVSLLTH